MALPGFLVSLFPAIIGVAIGIACYQMFQPKSLHRNQVYSLPSTTRSNSQEEKKRSKNECKICGNNIQDLENDLSKLPCDHQFHKKCISGNFRFRKNKFDEATCPVSGCDTKYSLAD